MHEKCNPKDCFLKDVLNEMLTHAKKRIHGSGTHGIVLLQMYRSLCIDLKSCDRTFVGLKRYKVKLNL